MPTPTRCLVFTFSIYFASAIPSPPMLVDLRRSRQRCSRSPVGLFENFEIGKENGNARIINNISETERRLREAVMIAVPEIGTLTD
ncbi:hypothetical protein [Paraburkholderia hospita]|uniref:hypothetical protein n=1 Tax=Paraburkholderia hospita TaxID=169430 RepID=UPI0012602513|nr:hypothetical protein [Paraburkholderia hospita]